MKDKPTEKTNRSGADPFSVAAVVAAVVLVLFPMVTSGFLPFVDLPQHVALAKLLGHINDPDISRTYSADLVPQVNVLGLLIMTSLLALIPEGAAVVVIIVMYVAGLAFAAVRLSRALGTSRGNATIALLFAVNFNLMYGFLSFCLGIPLLILVVARLAAPEEHASRRAVLADAALWMLLVLAHALLFVFALGSSLVWLALSPFSRGRGLRSLAPAAPAAVWTLGWYAAGRTGIEMVGGSGAVLEWHGLGEKAAGFGWSTTVAGVDGMVEWLLLAAAAALIAALLALELRASLGGLGRGTGEAWRRRARMRLWGRLLALLALALYLFLPYAVVSSQFITRGVFLLYNRFAVLAPLLLIPTLAWPRSVKSRRLVVSAALLLHVGLAWHWNDMMSRLSREASGLDGAIASMASGRILKSLIYTPYSDVIDFPSYLHAGSYYQGRKLGEVDQSFALLPTTPVHYREPMRPYLSQRDEHLAPHLFDWSRSSLYDYVLVYDRGGEWRRFYSSAPFERIYERNGWTVLDVKTRRR